MFESREFDLLVTASEMLGIVPKRQSSHVWDGVDLGIPSPRRPNGDLEPRSFPRLDPSPAC